VKYFSDKKLTVELYDSATTIADSYGHAMEVVAEACGIIVDNYRDMDQSELLKLLRQHDVQMGVLKYERSDHALLEAIYERVRFQIRDWYAPRVVLQKLMAHPNCPEWIKQDHFAHVAY
jgi:hypothetical protein